MKELTDKDFKIIKTYLETCKPKIRLGKDEDLRRFLDAIRHMSYCAPQWRELPDKYGSWNTIYKRFADWGERGIWRGLLEYLAAEDSDMEYVMVDSTVIRAHACCSTGKKKRVNLRKV